MFLDFLFRSSWQLAFDTEKTAAAALHLHDVDLRKLPADELAVGSLVALSFAFRHKLVTPTSFVLFCFVLFLE